MRDLLDRPLRDLRVSVTDRCNLRCPYCMPREVFGAGFEFLAREQLLSFEEIARVVALFARAGVAKVRLTGGEPLLRRGLERLVEMVAAVEGVQEVALTTNGLLLTPDRARRLADAGLTRATISLDALDAGVLRAMSGAAVAPARALAAIDAADAAGLRPVKVNMVVRRGVNEHCVTAMAGHFRGSGHVLRFIEYMDVGTTNGWQLGEVVPAGEMLAAVDARWPLEPLGPDPGASAPLAERVSSASAGGVASRYRYRDGAGEIGVIASVTEPFCGGCTRARLSADGKLFTCLFAQRGHDLRALLRGGGSDAELERAIAGVWRRRDDRYSAQRAAAGERRAAKVEMSYIGG
jgi:cyclic pyranopterin phosphate synthase